MISDDGADGGSGAGEAEVEAEAVRVAAGRTETTVKVPALGPAGALAA